MRIMNQKTVNLLKLTKMNLYQDEADRLVRVVLNNLGVLYNSEGKPMPRRDILTKAKMIARLIPDNGTVFGQRVIDHIDSVL